MFKTNPAQNLAFDLNGDGRTDYLAGAVDQYSVFLQSANGAFQSRSLSAPTTDAGWAIEGSADFDGDKKMDDLLWRNGATGQVFFELWEGDQIVQSAYSSVQTMNYSPYLADFDGDGKTEVMWHSPELGKVEVWFMEGAQIGKSLPLPNVASSWQPKLADFNNDGKTDLFWQDVMSGELRVWLLDGDRLIGNETITLPGNTGFLELYDFTGDGRTDIFDRNRLTGETRLWVWGEDGLRPNPTPVALPFAKPDGAFIFGDFNGDKRVDSIFRTPGVEASLWLTQADGVVTTEALTRLNSFIIDQINDFNRDGKADLLLENVTNNQAQLWLLDGSIINQVIDLGVRFSDALPDISVPSIEPILPPPTPGIVMAPPELIMTMPESVPVIESVEM
jgi:hypothetical protein